MFQQPSPVSETRSKEDPDQEKNLIKMRKFFALVVLLCGAASAAVVEAFKKVEAVLDTWQQGQGMTHPPSNESLVQWLVRDGYLSDVVFQLYKKVKQTRNIAVHSQSPNMSSGEAIAYKDLCERLARYLEEAIDEWDKWGRKPKVPLVDAERG